MFDININNKKPQKIKQNNKILQYFKNFKNKLQKFPIRIHPLFLLLCLIMALTNRFVLWAIYTLVALLHELAHYVIAKKLGYKLAKVKLMPYGAVLVAGKNEFYFKDEIMVALAGPCFNLLVGFLCVALWWLFPEIYYLTIDFAVANFVCGLFNLVPVFPLDGGRILLAIFSINHDREIASKLMNKVTLIFGVFCFAIFLISIFYGINFSLGFIGIMLIASVFNDDKLTAYLRIDFANLKRKKLNNGIVIKQVMLKSSQKLKNAYYKLSSFAYFEIVVVDDNFNKLGVLDEVKISNLFISGFANLTLEEALKL